MKSLHSAKSSFKTPNVVLSDYKFTPDQTGDTFTNPILGAHDVRNIHDLDWEGLKFAQMQEWSDICQDHYDAVVKLGAIPSQPTIGTRQKTQLEAVKEAPKRAVSRHRTRGDSRMKTRKDEKQDDNHLTTPA